MIDLSTVTAAVFKAGMNNHITCPWCDGKGCDDEFCDNGVVTLKRCSGCGQMKEPDHFYGLEKKQSRCIPCYKLKYFGDYRKRLRERSS